MTSTFKVTWFVSRVVLWDHVKIQNYHISTSTMLMATKLDSVATYHEGFSHITPYDPLITWSCEITWQTTRPMATKDGQEVTYRERFPVINSFNSLNMWLRVYRHQVCQGGNIPGGAPTHKFEWPLIEVAFSVYVTN